MSGKFVRASKFRHVYGQPFKKELCYENLKPTLSAFDSNIIQCNGPFISLNSNGIGAFTVIPIDEVGKAPDKVPMFRGHTGGNVLDTAFDPFDDHRILSSGEDGKILVWEIPENYSYIHVDPENIVDVKPIASLTGHSRKVGHLQFNPVAKDVVASSSFDYSVKVWNIKDQSCKATLQHKDLVTSFCFNYNGTKIATASRDKKIRIWDARSGELLSEGNGHLGAKSTRIVWLGNTDRLCTTGFDRFSERQLGLWKVDDLSSGPINGFISIDSSSGTLMPFYDPSTNLLFIAGKGDGNVRYYEFADDDLHPLSEYPSTEAQRGFAVAPKRFVNVKENEIIRAYKLLNDNAIEPLSFIVPRRSEMFQDDIYPDAPSDKPALSADEYFNGANVDGPILCSMRDIYDGVENPTLSKSKPPSKEEPKEPVKEIKKEEPKVEKKEQAEKKEEEPRPVFTQSQEQGVEKMLNEKGVNKLLDKVNSLSDDEYQGVNKDNDESENDVDDEWSIKKPSPSVSKAQTTPKKEIKELKETPKSTPLDSPKVTPKDPTKELLSAPTSASLSTPSSAPVPTPASPAVSTTSVKSGTAATGLKANLDKLHQLVSSLESNVEKLTLANQAKDERLKSLEEKIDLLLKK